MKHADQNTRHNSCTIIKITTAASANEKKERKKKKEKKNDDGKRIKETKEDD